MPGNAVQLPACDVSRLREIENIFSASLHSPIRRESLALAIENQNYIPKLCDTFRMCEDLDNIESLRLLYQIIKSMFMLNKNALLEILFNERHLKDVVGILEYDPSLPEPKRHRDYLWGTAAFREVIPIKSPELKAKIHQTYRVQYIQDVILPAPSIFEENMLSSLNSFIFFNRVEIVAMIQDDDQFLNDLFVQLRAKDTGVERRRDLTLFLKEFCTFAQTLQPSGPQGREVFFK
uniref:Serine/threonine-protein phosphatase 4 regulatory subunit 3-like central domain-containing protein n=1 Tax=Plectus sambesii TaxID=2011161 RepID=A0A914UMK5_9BILA